MSIGLLMSVYVGNQCTALSARAAKSPATRCVQQCTRIPRRGRTRRLYEVRENGGDAPEILDRKNWEPFNFC
jgi:hypothetical protein